MPVKPGPPGPAGPGGRRGHPAPGHTTRPGWPPRPAARPAGPDGDRFGLLLLVLIASYIMSSFLTGAWVSAVQIVLFAAVAMLAVRSSRVPRGTARTAIAVAVAGSFGAVVLALISAGGPGAGVASLWTGLVLLFAVALIVRRVLLHRTITLQSIFGAVSAYMILGLMFAAFYAAMNRFGGSFFASGGAANVKTLQYFSFTTLTTLGYGDFTAASSGGRSVAVMEALLGQVFLATLVARLVASFQPGARPVRGREPGIIRRPRRTGRPQAARPDRWRLARRRRRPGAVTRISSRARARRARR